MGTRERRQKEREARREAILDAAERVFSSRGMDGASLEEVAQAAELGKATLYYYFPGGKKALQRAVLERAARRFFEDLIEHLGPAESLEQGVETLLTRYLDFFTSNPDTLAVVYPTMLSHGGPGSRPRLEGPPIEGGWEVHKAVTETLRERVVADAPGVAPEDLLSLLMDFLVGLGARMLAGASTEQLRRDVACFVDILAAAACHRRGGGGRRC